MKNLSVLTLVLAALVISVVLPASTPGARAQDSSESARVQPPPPVVSPEVSADRKLTFRIRAASATAVRLEGSDIPGLGRGAAMTKGEDGVWQLTLGPLPPGAYRYNFDVDGVRVIDPVHPLTSESNSNTWSLAVVPGSDLVDTRDVPHGAVAQVTYFSSTLGRPRRMHIYTPPGYESGAGKLPVLYLLHGASDSDASWPTVGRAGFILDNLIAAGRAAPMVVVMPAGHTGPFRFGAPHALDRQVNEFVEDFLNDLKPCVESRYRVRGDRASRAIAGLSMGGAQTLEIAMRKLDDFAYVGVFSSGVFGLDPRRPAPSGPTWVERHKQALEGSELKKGLRLVWFATGKDDFLIETTRRTVSLLREAGFDVTFQETEGGHTWLNWRSYLAEFTPLLFQETTSSDQPAAARHGSD
jgi:enterochelin esterase family protein